MLVQTTNKAHYIFTILYGEIVYVAVNIYVTPWSYALTGHTVQKQVMGRQIHWDTIHPVTRHCGVNMKMLM